MRKSSLLRFAALLLLLVTRAEMLQAQGGIGSGEAPDQRAVRDSFAAYKAALMREDGRAAAPLVTEGTVRYYGRMRDLALKGQEAEVKQLSAMNKFIVLRMRHQVGLESLRNMSDEDMFVYGIDKGWTGKESVAQAALGKIDVTGDVARSEVIEGGKLIAPKFTFRKEGERWKIDLTANFPTAELMLKGMMKEWKMEEDAFIFETLEILSGKKVMPAVWQPLIK